MEWSRGKNELTLKAYLDESLLPSIRKPLDLGISAVLENIENELSYWALKHASDRADFHDLDTFVCILE